MNLFRAWQRIPDTTDKTVLGGAACLLGLLFVLVSFVIVRAIVCGCVPNG